MTIEYVPKDMAEIVEVVRLIPQERVHQRTVEQIVHVTAPQVVEEIAEVVQTIPRRASRSVSPMCQVLKQSQVPTIQTVPRTVREQMPQMQFRDVTAEANPSPEGPEEDRDSTRSALDKTVDVPVVQDHRSTSWKRRQRPHSCRSSSKTLRSPRSRHSDF